MQIDHASAGARGYSYVDGVLVEVLIAVLIPRLDRSSATHLPVHLPCVNDASIKPSGEAFCSVLMVHFDSAASILD